MFLRSFHIRLLRSYTTSAQSDLLNQIEKTIEKLKINDELESLKETFAYKNFEVYLGDCCKDIKLTKKVGEKTLEVTFQAEKESKFNSNMIKNIKDKKLDFLKNKIQNIPSSTKGILLPIKFQVSVINKDSMNIYECLALRGAFKIHNLFITNYPRTVPLISKNKKNLDNRGLLLYKKKKDFQEHFKAYIKSFGIDRELISHICDISVETNKKLEKNWLENIKTFLTE